DGRSLVYIEGSRLGWLDVRTGRNRRVLKADPECEFTATAFSPDGRLLAAAGSNGNISLWDLGTGECRSTFSGHDGFVWALTFFHDGRTLASGGFDTTVLLWDVPPPAPLAPLAEAELKPLLADLDHAEPSRYAALLRACLASPDQAMPLLRQAA